jgi:hypothetical protein
MKTAISIPDTEFEHFERVAARHGMNRSQFYRRAAGLLAAELEGDSDLTRVANAVLRRAGSPAEDGAFLQESEARFVGGTEW